MDAVSEAKMIKRLGAKAAHLSDRLNRAFTVFSSLEIYSIYLRFPKNTVQQVSWLHDALRTLFGYRNAVAENVPIVFKNDANDAGETKSYPVILNGDGIPDENLTFLTIANQLKSQFAEKLVEKIGASPLKDRYLSIYNAVYAVQKFKGRLVRPPIEL